MRHPITLNYPVVVVADCLQPSEFIPQTTLEDMHLWSYGFLGFAGDFFKLYPDSDKFIMPARFSQDSLENLFGRIREVGGTANNPGVMAAAQALNTVQNMHDIKVARGSYTQRNS